MRNAINKIQSFKLAQHKEHCFFVPNTKGTAFSHLPPMAVTLFSANIVIQPEKKVYIYIKFEKDLKYNNFKYSFVS